MNSRIYSIKLFVLTFLFLSNINSAQFYFSVSTDQEYNDNPFNSPTPFSSMISSYDLGVEAYIDNFNLGYYGSYTMFSEFSQRNFLWHQFGLWYYSENGSITAGLYGEQRINNDLYNFYDYMDFTGYVKYLFQLEDFYNTLHLNLELTKYDYFTELNNWLASVGYKLSRSFESGTTIIGGGIFSYKNYFDDEIVISSGGNKTPYTMHLAYFGRIAQSITSRTGLAAQFTNRHILDGTGNYNIQLNQAYGDESGLFDDPVSYEGYAFTTELTQILPLEIILKAGYSYNNKDYKYQGIYTGDTTYTFTTTRFDKQNNLYVGLKKSFPLSETSDTELIVSLRYQMINNSSNSYWYKYKSNLIGLNIDLQF
ncbi:MAG: hypothetical protein JXA68_02600 [Ignavibacteriales bacterium]|nr:hypothetical protein [Ignavibacteriales bacterium]